MLNLSHFQGLSSVTKIYGKLPSGKLSLSTDSRNYKSGEIFWALKGEKFDGDKYIPNVLAQECPVVVFNDDGRGVPPSWTQLSPRTCFVGATDSTLLLQQFARAVRLDWGKGHAEKKIIGITGSNGKTTTKEMLYHFLSAALPGKVLGTEKNLNNHIGVPLTLLRLAPEIEVGVLEMGMSHPGEINVLCETALPDAGIITNIGPAHIEFFGSLAGIFTEKKCLYDWVMKHTQGEGQFIVNYDDPFLRNLSHTEKSIFFSHSNSSASVDYVYEVDLKKGKVSICGKQSFILENAAITGRHNFLNLTATFLMALVLYPQKEAQLIAAAKTFTPRDNRSQWIKLSAGPRVFMDAYNANPGSMEAAITGFQDHCKVQGISTQEQFYVLGDMNELGEYSSRGHQHIGQLLQQLGIKNVAFVGQYRQHYAQGYQGQHLSVANTDEFLRGHWKSITQRYKNIFLKGSRSLQFEKLLDI